MKNTLKLCVGICFLLLTFFAATGKAEACACCAEPGTWFQRSVKNDSGIANITGELLDKLGDSATLYSNAAGFGRGILPEPQSETFKLRRMIPRSLQTWLNFTDERGNSGRLSFNSRDLNSPTLFAVDLRERSETNSMVFLYKELRFEGTVSGSGIFGKGLASGARYRLIFQGRGNMCHDASDFKTWILQVNGANADFSFYGSFKSE